MDYRKLIKFGNSSYVVSLPKEWINKNSLKKGDVVYFNENGNSELVVSLNNKTAKEPKRTVMELDGKDAEYIKRDLVSKYIADYDIIKIVGSSIRDQIKPIKETIEKLVGMEIIEQTSKQIIIKNLLDSRKVSINNLTKRMNIIVRSMIEDSKLCYKEKNCESLFQRESDVKRLSFLIFRIIKGALNDPYIAKSLRLNQIQLLEIWLFVDYVRRIAGSIKRIGRNLERIKFNKEELTRLLELYSIIEAEYNTVLTSYYKNDKSLALRVASKKDEIIKMCDDVALKFNKIPCERLITKLKFMETEIRNISRLVYQNE